MQIKEKKILDLLKQEEFYLKDVFVIVSSAIKKSVRIIISLALALFIFLILDFYFAPIEYESKASVMIEQQGSPINNNGLNNLLGLTNGMNNPSVNIGIGPDMYNELLKSQVFLNELIQSRVPVSQNSKDSITLENFFANGENLSFYQKIKSPSAFFKKSKVYEIALPQSNRSKIIPLDYNDSDLIVKKSLNPELIFSNQIPPIVEIDNSKSRVIGIMKKRIRLEMKDKNVTVYTKMPNSFQSAVVGKVVLENLLKYITAFKTHRQLTNIEFLEKRVFDSENRYKKALQNIAGYKDNTLGIILQSAQTREQILNNEVTLSFNLYNQFTVQLEQAKIDLKKETPYFSILEPINIPSAQIEPSLVTFIVRYIAIFVSLTFLIVLYKLFF
jgi:hypothetical protein